MTGGVSACFGHALTAGVLRRLAACRRTHRTGRPVDGDAAVAGREANRQRELVRRAEAWVQRGRHRSVDGAAALRAEQLDRDGHRFGPDIGGRAGQRISEVDRGGRQDLGTGDGEARQHEQHGSANCPAAMSCLLHWSILYEAHEGTVKKISASARRRASGQIASAKDSQHGTKGRDGLRPTPQPRQDLRAETMYGRNSL